MSELDLSLAFNNAMSLAGRSHQASQSQNSHGVMNRSAGPSWTQLVYPVGLEDHILSLSSRYHNPQLRYEYTVTASVGISPFPLERYHCGTFASLTQANATVLRVFAADQWNLMPARYNSMRFLERGEPYDDVTAVGFHRQHMTLRIWASDTNLWTFKVEALRAY
jgi:hypothetical protein